MSFQNNFINNIVKSMVNPSFDLPNSVDVTTLP